MLSAYDFYGGDGCLHSITDIIQLRQICFNYVILLKNDGHANDTNHTRNSKKIVLVLGILVALQLHDNVSMLTYSQ